MNALVARRLCCLAWAIFFSLQAALAAPPANRPGARTSSSASSSAAPSPAQAPATWTFPSSKFITALCVDQQNNLWVGTEDEGIWRCPADGSKPQQFMPKDGLGDEHCYALACDTLGRIWAGHQSHGVSVWNGQKWQNYEVVGGLSRPDTLNGPLGERIFDIEVCPTDGDVWMATSLGLARYRLQQGEWQYFTRLEGLPSDQIQAIAFDKQGTLYAGTQCDGLAIAKGPAYAKWQVVQGPDKLPLTPNGMGLPTNLINDVLVSREGTVWVATTAGLAFSKDKGKSFRYVRGADWVEKVKGLYRPAQNVSKRGEETNRRMQAEQRDGVAEVIDAGKGAWTLLEDYVTCLTEDAMGGIWIGHRHKSCEAVDGVTGQRIEHQQLSGLTVNERDHFVFTMISCPDRVILGRYGDGVQVMQGVGFGVLQVAEPASPSEFPSPALPPTADYLGSFVAQNKSRRMLAKGSVGYLADDWMTKGDWVGRYGRQHNVLCAMMAPCDHKLVWDSDHEIQPSLGPNCVEGDQLRNWIHWTKTDQSRCLYNPVAGVRRQAEWDDHGETYPLSVDGPDIWIRLRLPEGVHRVSFYFVNKDGHEGMNRLRDYLLEFYPADADPRLGRLPVPLSRLRVRDFWGGVYKQAVLSGPNIYHIRLARNHSYNAIISGIFVDRVVGQMRVQDTWALAWFGGVEYRAPLWSRSLMPDQDATESRASEVWQSLESAWTSQGSIESQRRSRLMCYRSISQSGSASQLANWRWHIPLWTQQDRTEFAETVERAWTRQLVLTPKVAWSGRPSGNAVNK